MLRQLNGILILLGAPALILLIIFQQKTIAVAVLIVIGLISLYSESTNVFFRTRKNHRTMDEFLDAMPFLVSKVSPPVRLFQFLSLTFFLLTLWPFVYAANLVRIVTSGIAPTQKMMALQRAQNIWVTSVFVSLYGTLYFVITHAIGHKASPIGQIYIYALIINNGLALFTFIITDIRQVLRQAFGDPRLNYLWTVLAAFLLAAGTCFLMLPAERQTFDVLPSVASDMVSAMFQVDFTSAATSLINESSRSDYIAALLARNWEYYVFGSLFYASVGRVMWSTVFSRKSLKRSSADYVRLATHRILQNRWQDAQAELDKAEALDANATLLGAIVGLERGLVDDAIKRAGSISRSFGRDATLEEGVLRIADAFPSLPISSQSVAHFVKHIIVQGYDEHLIFFTLQLNSFSHKINPADWHALRVAISASHPRYARVMDVVGTNQISAQDEIISAYLNGGDDMPTSTYARFMLGSLLIQRTDSFDPDALILDHMTAVVPLLIADAQGAPEWKLYLIWSAIRPLGEAFTKNSFDNNLPIEVRTRMANLATQLVAAAPKIRERLDADPEYGAKTQLLRKILEGM